MGMGNTNNNNNLASTSKFGTNTRSEARQGDGLSNGYVCLCLSEWLLSDDCYNGGVCFFCQRLYSNVFVDRFTKNVVSLHSFSYDSKLEWKSKLIHLWTIGMRTC